MYILGVVDFNDQLVSRYILPERLVRLVMKKLELQSQSVNYTQPHIPFTISVACCKATHWSVWMALVCDSVSV